MIITMGKDIPVVTAAAVAVVEAADPITQSQAAMWERPAVLITRELSMTELSLTLLTIVDSRWNLSAELDR